MEVGSLSVPVRADLGPITADLARLKKQLDELNAGRGGTGLDKIPGQLVEARKQTTGLTAALRPLAGALAGVFGTQQLIKFTDTWTDLTSRVNLAAGSIETGGAVMDQLQVIARRTYSSLEQTTEAYIRNAQTLRDLGRSTQETLDYTEALNNALVVSGARADRAASVQDALGKAMAAGKLSGDSLNTVIERGGRVAELLAEELGTTVSGLRQMGTDGKITGDVIDRALVGNLEKLREEAESMPATIGDAFQLISNSLLQTIGVFDQANEVSGTFAGWLIAVADNMQRVITYVGTATTAWIGYSTYLAIVNSQLVTTIGLVGALRVAFQRLLLSTVIGALVVAVGELITQIYYARQAVDSWAEAWADLWDRAKALTTAFTYYWESAVAQLGADWRNMLAGIVEATSGALNAMLGMLGIASTGLSEFGEGLRREAESLAALAESTQNLGNLAFNYGTRARETGGSGVDLSGDGGPNRVVPSGDGANGGRAVREAAREAERLAEAYQDLVRDSQAFIDSQAVEQQMIGLTELEAAKLRNEFDLLNAAKRAGIELTPQQTAELTRLAHQMAEAEDATRRLREQYDFAKDTFKGFFTDLKSELQNGASIWEAFGTAAANALQKIADKALDLALNGIFDMIFGAFGGAGRGGGGGGFFSRLFGFENGTNYAPGGWSVVGERGPELLKLPAGSQVVPNNRVNAPVTPSFGSGGMSGASSGPREIHVVVNGARGNTEIREMVNAGVADGLAEYDAHQLPGSVQRIREHPRMR